MRFEDESIPESETSGDEEEEEEEEEDDEEEADEEEDGELDGAAGEEVRSSSATF